MVVKTILISSRSRAAEYTVGICLKTAKILERSKCHIWMIFGMFPAFQQLVSETCGFTNVDSDWLWSTQPIISALSNQSRILHLGTLDYLRIFPLGVTKGETAWVTHMQRDSQRNLLSRRGSNHNSFAI